MSEPATARRVRVEGENAKEAGPAPPFGGSRGMKCPRCHHENPTGMKFCGQCAAPLASTCPSCGAANPPENKFCGQCAAPLLIDPDHEVRRAGLVYAEAPRREDPHLQGCARRRAQAGHGALRRPQGLDGAARRPRSRGGAQDPRPGARAHDGSRPPLRGHRQSGDGRRDHGAVRRAPGARGPRGARLLRGAADAGGGQALRRGRTPASTVSRSASAWG